MDTPPTGPGAPLPPPPPGAQPQPAPAPAPAPVPAPPPPPAEPAAPVAPIDDSPTITDWVPPAAAAGSAVPPPGAPSDAVPPGTPPAAGGTGWGAPPAQGWGTPASSATPPPASGTSKAPLIVVTLVAFGLVAGAIGFMALSSGKAPATPAPTATVEAALTPAPDTATPAPSDVIPTAAPASDAPVPDTSADPGASPVYGTTEDVAALRALVPEDIRSSCASAEIYGNQVAALQCEAPDAGSLYYELYPDRERLDASWAAMLSNNDIAADSGSCSSGTRGEAGWYYEGGSSEVDEGRDACYVEDDGTAVFLWTDYTVLTRGWLFGQEGDTIQDTWDRWNQGDLDPVRP